MALLNLREKRRHDASASDGVLEGQEVAVLHAMYLSPGAREMSPWIPEAHILAIVTEIEMLREISSSAMSLRIEY